ncbi:M20 family metallopeptidase [Bacteroidota bacterium]
MTNFFLSKKDFYTELFSKLIAAKSINPPGDEYLVAEVITNFLDSIGVEYEVHSKDEKRPNIIAKIKNGDGKKLMMLAHMDVVPPGDGWKTEPFKLTKKEGKFYGRGTSDDKGPLLSILMLLDYFNNNKNFKGEFIAVFTSDEEKGGEYGAKFLIENKLLDADIAIVADSSGEMQEIIVGEKGILNLKVTAKGKKWHSAYPMDGGKNAVVMMSKFLSKLENYTLKHEKNKLFSPPTIVATDIKGGIANNVIPDKCEANLNIRIVPKQTEESVVEELKEISKEFGEFEFETEMSVRPFEISSDLDIINMITEKGKSEGLNIQCKGQNGGTDANKLFHAGIPVISFSFVEDGTAHLTDEYVKEEMIYNYANLMVEVISEYLK